MKNKNDQKIANYMVQERIWAPKKIHRSTLVVNLKISRSTVYDSLMRLIRKGIVRKIGDTNFPIEGPGRPEVFFQLVSEEF